MFKKLIRPFALVVLWLLHRIMFGATYGIIYLESYLDDEPVGQESAEVKNLYINDLSYFKGLPEVILDDNRVQLVYRTLKDLSPWSTKGQLVDAAIQMIQHVSAIPQIRTNADGKRYYAFVTPHAETPKNIRISMWMAYFYMYHHGDLNDE